MTSPYDTYSSPLASRNASEAMLRLWSPRHKFNTWRRVWLAVAEAQHEMGLPVSKEQVEELRAVVNRPGGITDEEMRAAEKYERDLRHDVMAHVHALGDSCPKAKGIIHLGMTSQDVVCNADLMTMSPALHLTLVKIVRVCSALSDFAQRHKRLPALGFTHYQPAQPITVGRRAAGWASDLMVPVNGLCPEPSLLSGWNVINRLRGMRGATGTQASFLELFGGDHARVEEFEARVLEKLSFVKWTRPTVLHSDEELVNDRLAVIEQVKEHIEHSESRGDHKSADVIRGQLAKLEAQSDLDFRRESAARVVMSGSMDLTGQTYPRVFDAVALSQLAAAAAVLHKIATDIRLLSNRKELDEPFEDKQIGSSAMPYKRNPMRCERICGLTRFVMNLVGNAYDTAATQWLERTLDDSSNRRLSLPEAFLALDGALDLMHNVASGLIVHEAMVRRNLMAELPFMATENILMECVKLGGDRQHYHELIRVHAQAAGMRVKQEGLDNDLLERLQKDKAFSSKARGGGLTAELDWNGLMDPMKYIGRSVEQTERFIKEVVEPLREQYGEAIAKLGESGPRV